MPDLSPETLLGVWEKRADLAADAVIKHLKEAHRLAKSGRQMERDRQAEREGAIARIRERDGCSASAAKERTRSDDRYADFVRRQDENTDAHEAALEELEQARLDRHFAAMAHERAAILARIALTEVNA